MNKSIYNTLKTIKNSLFLISFCFLTISYAEIQEIPPITFGGGVDYKTDCSDIQDNRACDMNNMISDYLGTTHKRYGSKKIIDQAISSVPVQGLFRTYYSTGSTTYRATLMINDGKIYVDTVTTATGHLWTEKKAGLNKTQNYNFQQYAHYVLIAGDSLNDNIMRYDIQTTSITEHITSPLSPVQLTAKHHIFSKNYYLAGNIKDLTYGTTYYPSRVHFSILVGTYPYMNELSSMTTFRYFDVSNDGEEITGMGEIGNVHIFKPSSISELQYEVLNFTSLGGDQTLSRKVSGFGCIAPRSLASTGKLYIFLSKDGIRVYDPAGRDTLADETKLISTSIEPIIKRMLEAGTYTNAHSIYYGKRNWYIFSFEDPLKYPKNRPNSTLVFDINTGEWFPFSNWIPECYATFDNVSDNQEIVYGDANDGYVYYFDNEKYQNDSRKEIVIDNCDIPSKWTSAKVGAYVKEGTSSIKLSAITPTFNSSVTLMQTINLGEWYDKSSASKDDKISFKVYPSSLANISAIRIDLELDLRSDTFDTNFTSVTISSASLTSGTSAWSTVEIALSSFPILDTWINTSSGSLPFAESPTVYGFRIYSEGIEWHELTIDDVRFVKNKETELNAFRLSKQFNLGTNADKIWRQIILDCEQSATSRFYIDYFSNFGEYSGRETITNSFDNYLFLTGYKGKEGVFKLDSNDFTLLDSSEAIKNSAFSPRPMTASENHIFTGDQYNHRIMKFDRDDLTTLVSSVGSLGSGSLNFNNPFQMAVIKKDSKYTLFVCDFKNHSVKVYDADTLRFKKSFGELGNGTTNFYCPTGIAADDVDVFIAQDASSRLQKWGWDGTNFKYKDSIVLNLNTASNVKLASDQKYVYVYYAKISENNYAFTELWLEIRNKSDLKLVSKKMVLPENISVVASTYSVMGDIGINDNFLFLSFTNDANGNGRYYIQKLLKDGVNFPIIKEFSDNNLFFSLASNGLSYKPKRKSIFKDIGTDTAYIQFRFSEDLLDNSFKLYKMSPLLIQKKISER